MRTTLDSTCYTIEDMQIVEHTLRDFSHFIETTTRPCGVGPKYYATTIRRTVDAVLDDDDNEIEPVHEIDIWCLAYWVTWAGPERIIQEFDSEEGAAAAAEQVYIDQILNNHEVFITTDRAAAEKMLQQMIDEMN